MTTAHAASIECVDAALARLAAARRRLEVAPGPGQLELPYPGGVNFVVEAPGWLSRGQDAARSGS